MDEHREQQQDGPGTGPQDEAFARLRAADPAAGAQLDVAALRARVAERADAGTDAGAGAGDGATVTSLAGRRRARWLQVAAAGVGVALAAGAGGYAVGAAGDDDGSGVTAAAPISLGGGAGVQELSGAASTADMRIMPGFGFGGRTVFSAQGLGDDAGQARAWALDAASVFSADSVARLASALGVPGDPRQEYGAWIVGPQDGAAPSVSLQPDGTASFSYYDPTRDPWSCWASATDSTDGTDGSGSDGTATDGSAPGEATLDPQVVEPALPSAPSTPSTACDALGDAPTGDAAVGQVRDLLVTLGVDPAGFEYQVADPGDVTTTTTVDAYQVLDGQQTGLTWNVTLVGDGVQAVYGSLAPLVDLGEYPVVGAATAVERLNDPRFGAGYGGVMPLARDEAADATTMIAPEPTDPTVPPTVTPGSTLAWPVQHVTITGARLGLGLQTQADGAALLVPSYELTGSDGSTWTVVGVDESALDLAG